MSTVAPDTEQLWAEEPSHLEGRARIRARIAGIHCPLCTGTIEKALGREAGVDKVAVSLTHEQALVAYDPRVIAQADSLDRKSTRLNSRHKCASRMPSSA